MAILNPPLLDVQPVTSSGMKLGYVGYKQADGSISKGLKRAFGGPTATNGVSNITDKLMHDATTETYDDEWIVNSYAVDDSPSVDLTLTVITYMKKIEIFVLDSTFSSTGGIFIGPANTVTATAGSLRGRYLPPGSSYLMPLGPNMKIWAICASGLVANVQVVQFA